MGHLVNPISYRLGVSKCWNSSWMQDPFFSSNYSSLVKSDNDIFLFFRRFFDLKLILQSGYIFSHVKIIRDCNKLFCVVYFYDGGSLERSDLMRNIILSDEFQLFMLTTIFFLSLKSFLRLYEWNFNSFRIVRNFKFDFLFQYFNRKKRFLLIRSRLKKLFYSLFFNQFIFYLKFLFLKQPDPKFLKILLFLDLFKSRKIDLKLLYYLLPFLISFTLPKEFFVSVFFHLRKTLGLLNNFRTRFFNLLLNFFLLLRWKISLKIRHLTRMLRVGLTHFSFNRYFLHYFGDFFFFSVRIQSRLFHALNHSFRSLFLSKNLSDVKIILKKLELTELNATIISKYLAVRLRQRFQLKEALFPVLRYLSHSYLVRGFRIVCAGRFTRKEIALYDVRTFSSVPFSGGTSRLDFSLSEVILKYSICGIKVWLHKRIITENFFTIRGIGMNFLHVPSLSGNFQKFFRNNLKVLSRPYHPDFLNKKILNKTFRFFRRTFKRKSYFRSIFSDLKKGNKKASKNFATKFSFRMSPVLDFFFFNLISKSKKEFKNKKKFSSSKSTFSMKR